MRIMLAPLFLAIAAAASPAHATGGMVCRTADGSAVEIAIAFGHVAGAPIIATRLNANGTAIPVLAPQWWLDDAEMRLMLTDNQALNRVLTLRAKRVGPHYDGQVEWDGKSRWIRCRED